jgi:hypothetical protein
MDELSAAAIAYARLKDDLIAATGMAEDDECLSDTLDGEIDLNEVIIRAMREAKRAEVMAKAMDAIIADNKTRKDRYKKTNESIRKAIAKAMKAATIPRIRAADLTISPTTKFGGPRIANEDILPAWAKSEETVFVPNVKAILEAYELSPSDFTCPGVEIVPDEPSISVRAR